MKTIVSASIMTVLLFAGAVAQSQNREEYLGLPGDNLNLYAVMKLFQESETLEEFERNLNDENSRINNLDLNGDNQIDYIHVFDNVYNNVHNIVLQVAINRNERQDVAVFTVERDNNGNVWLQLTGDEALYGKNYIIEPIVANVAETPNPGYIGNAATVNGQRVVVAPAVVEISAWPLIVHIYGPRYVVWRSPWYWGYYPAYWRPWRPYYWHYYYGYHYNWYPRYYSYYHRIDSHRHDYWNSYYYRQHRTYSVIVTNNIRAGRYRVTYSRPAERSRGEALYISTYGNNNRRQESVRTIDANRRNTVGTTNSRTTVNRPNVNNSSASTRRNTPNSNAARVSPPSQQRSNSTPNNARSSSGRTSQPEARTSTQARPSERTARSNESRTIVTPRTRTESGSRNSASSANSGTTSRSSGTRGASSSRR